MGVGQESSGKLPRPLIGRRPLQRKDVVCAKALRLQRVRWVRDGAGVGGAHRGQTGERGQVRLGA